MAKRSRSTLRPAPQPKQERWVSFLPNWISAAAALASVVVAAVGLKVATSDPIDAVAPASPQASLGTLTLDDDGLSADGEYEGLRRGAQAVALMLRRTDEPVGEWTVVETDQVAEELEVDPQAGVWSAEAPITAAVSWTVRVVVLPADMNAAVAPVDFARLRREGPSSSLVVYAAPLQVAEPAE